MRRKTSNSKRSSKEETKKILVSTSYVRRGRSGVRNLVRARFSIPEHTDPDVHSASCTMGTWSLSRAEDGRGVAFIIHLHLAPRL